MSQVSICDRCGSHDGDVTVSIEERAFKWQHYDLCKACTKQLRIWLKAVS